MYKCTCTCVCIMLMHMYSCTCTVYLCLYVIISPCFMCSSNLSEGTLSPVIGDIRYCWLPGADTGGVDWTEKQKNTKKWYVHVQHTCTCTYTCIIHVHVYDLQKDISLRDHYSTYLILTARHGHYTCTCTYTCIHVHV